MSFQRKQTTEPGEVALAAPCNVLGEDGLVPELLSFPFAAAYKVQFVANEACMPAPTLKAANSEPTPLDLASTGAASTVRGLNHSALCLEAEMTRGRKTPTTRAANANTNTECLKRLFMIFAPC